MNITHFVKTPFLTHLFSMHPSMLRVHLGNDKNMDTIMEIMAHVQQQLLYWENLSEPQIPGFLHA